jgi:hypothetical protein
MFIPAANSFVFIRLCTILHHAGILSFFILLDILRAMPNIDASNKKEEQGSIDLPPMLALTPRFFKDIRLMALQRDNCQFFA